MVDGSGPIGDAFRACHACTVSAAVKVTVRPDAVADHLYAAILTRGREGVNRTLETVEGARLIPGHSYLEGLGVQYTTHKRAHFHRRGRETMSIAPS